MMIARRLAEGLALAALLALPGAGCSKTPEKAPTPEKAAPEKAAPEKASPEKAATPDKASPTEDPMKSSPFDAARARFTQGVAAAFGRDAGGIKVIPTDPTATNTSFDPWRTGPLMAWEATWDAVRIRGFAAQDGSVVLLKQTESLAALFDAAAAAKVDAPALAARITWMMGPGHTLIFEPEDAQMDPPPAELPVLTTADGARTLRFVIEQAGDTGVLLSWQITVVVGADGTVELRRARA